jgi:hypothetical protein
MRVRPQHVQDAGRWSVLMLSTATVLTVIVLTVMVLTVMVLRRAALVAMARVRVAGPAFGLPPVRFTHVTQDAPAVALQHIDND